MLSIPIIDYIFCQVESHKAFYSFIYSRVVGKKKPKITLDTFEMTMRMPVMCYANRGNDDDP